MKHYLLAGLLLAAAPTLAQTAPPAGQEAAAPFKKANVILLRANDSAAVAFKKIESSLLAAGYGIDKKDRDALFLSTPAKSLDGKVFLKLRLVVTPENQGCVVAMRGVYSWVTATTLMAHLENRELPVEFIGGENSPTKKAWQEIVRIAQSYPGATLTYKAQP